MSFEENSIVEIEDDVENFIQNIENQYSTKESRDFSIKENNLRDDLIILSQEFDTLGISTINLSSPPEAILEQLLSSTQSLIHEYRKKVSEIKDVNINSQSKNTKNYNLEKKNNDLHLKLNKSLELNSALQSKVNILKVKCTEIEKLIATHKEEKDKIKRYYGGKNNELTHTINQLKSENQRLKEICGKGIGKYTSADEALLQLLKSYKKKEEIYKNIILKLEENNKGLVEETVRLREDLVLTYCNNKV